MKSVYIFIFCFFAVSLSQGAALDPKIEWKLLETAHFEIIYDARNHSQAAEYAAQAERAHTILAPLFPVLPSKTIVFVNDWTDLANGFATTFPRPQITVFPVLPSFQDSISHYDNWSQQLILHEYAHILSMEETNGFITPLRFLFGSIVKPTAVLPRWYLEGLAVELESRYTRWGRLRSPFYQALSRAMIKDGTWYDDSIAQVNESMNTWPYGMRPYFWGSLIMHEIAERKGPKAMIELNSRYGGRVPFFINAPVEDLLGVDYSGLLKEIREKYDNGAKAQLQQIAKAGQPQQTLISENGLGHSPQISPDGKKLAFIATNSDGDNELRIGERGTTASPFTGFSKVLTTGKRLNRISWLPDSLTLVFDKVAAHGLYIESSDLYVINLADGKEKQITEGLRAQEPFVDSKGQNIAFIKLDSNGATLSTVNRDGKNLQTLYTAPVQARLSRPSFLNSNEIIFSERALNGKEYLKVLNTKTKQTRNVLEQFEPALIPQMTSKGVVFVSEKTGISNLYLANQSLTDAQALTNTTTKILMGTIDATTSDLYVSELSSTGARIMRQDFPSQYFQPPVVQNMTTSRWSEYQEPAKVTTAIEKPYQPLRYLWPQYWMPLFSLIPDGIFLQATTGASDPLGIHSYSLDATYDSLAQKPGGALSYSYATGATNIFFSASYQPIYYYAIDLATPSYGTGVGVSFPLSSKSRNWRMTARFSYDSNELPGAEPYRQGGPALGIRYDNSSQKGSGISPDSGGMAYLEQQHFFQGIGNLDYGRTRANGAYYLSKWLPKNHVLMGRLNSTWSPANRSALLGSSAGGDYSFTFNEPQYTVRGYPVGEFLGWSLVTSTLEYRFPLWNVYGGWDTRPFFLKRWHGAVFVDAVALDGFYFARNIRNFSRTQLGNIFYSSGLELRSDITLAYHVPATFRIGLFYGLNNEAFGGFAPFIGLTLPRF